MIKTDRVIYRTRTQEEYDWLMQELEKAGCIWREGNPPTRQKPYWKNFRSDTCIRLRNKKITYEGSDYYEYDPDEGDYEFIEVSDLMKRTIKTDKVIYHVRTQKEYNWLMEKLEEAGITLAGGNFPIAPIGTINWEEYLSETCIRLDDQIITYANFNFYKNQSDYKDYEFIKVSDLMENEEKTEILDKLETMNKQLKDELKKLKEEDDESQTIKKVVYTTEVYFE